MSKKSENAIFQLLAYAELGGAAEIGLRLAQDLQARGHKSFVVTPSTGRARQASLLAGLQNVAFNNSALFSKSRLKSLAGNGLLAKSLRVRSPQLIHVHCPFAYAAFRWAIRLSGAQRVVHVHIETASDVLQWVFRDPPELVVTCARYLADHVRNSLELRSAGTRVEAVPNSVDITKFYPGDRAAARKKVGICTEKAVVLILANIAPHKGHATAIRAIHELKKNNKNVELWCAGVERHGCAYTAELREMASQLNLTDNVRFLGYRSDAPDLLRAADALLLPSTHEGLPLTILEAQATKIPVVAAPTAGIPEVVCDGETGFLIAHDDFQGYADRLESLIAKPDAKLDITDCAYANVLTNHTWDEYKRRMFQLYEKLIQKP